MISVTNILLFVIVVLLTILVGELGNVHKTIKAWQEQARAASRVGLVPGESRSRGPH